jgi:hypothetical protein
MKKVIGILLAALLLLTCLPLTALAEPAQIGTVTVSIVDNGDRDYLLEYLDEEDMAYLTPFGTIVAPTEVPIYEGDSAANALVRLFEMKDIPYVANNSPDYQGGFYLRSITFTKDGETVENFGEGSITPDDEYMFYFSGWMVKLNNWFTSSGISNYLAEDGDIIEVLYTCSMGADVGNDWSAACADLTGLNVSAGTLSPAFSADVKAYTLTVDENTDSVKLAAENVYYGAEVTYTVGEVSYKYMRAIPVTNGTVITVNSRYYTTDYSTGEKTLVDEDEITVTVVKPEAETPAEPEAPAAEKSFIEKIKDAFSTFFNFLKSFFARIADFFTKLFK